MRLVIHPALVLQIYLLLPQIGGTLVGADPGIDYRPAPIFPILAEKDIKIIAGLAVIHDQQHRARWNPGVLFHEIGKLQRSNGLEPVVMEAAHQPAEIVF